MPGDVASIKARIDQAREIIQEARKSCRNATSNNDSAGLRSNGMRTWAESTLSALIQAHDRTEQALSVLRTLEAETNHPDPRIIALHLLQGIEQIERMIANTRYVLSKVDELDHLFADSAMAMPSNHLSLADNVAEHYRQGM